MARMVRMAWSRVTLMSCQISGADGAHTEDRALGRLYESKQREQSDKQLRKI
jgi:hypothetical protein